MARVSPARFGLLGVLLGSVLLGGLLWGRRAPEDPALTEARRLLRIDRLEEAESHLVEYLRREPESAAGRFLRGRALRRLGRLAEAQSQLRRARQLGWEESAVEREEQLTRWQRGDLAKSGPYLEQLLAADDPHPEDIYEARVLRALEIYRPSEASAWLEKWAAHAPESVRARMLLGWGYEQGHRWKMAEAEYRQALAVDPDNAIVRRALGNVLLQQNRPAEARDEFERCRQLDGGEPATVRGLVASHESLGEPELALSVLESAVRAHPKQAPLWAELGKLQWQQGHLPEADRSLATSLELDPHSPEAHYTMSQIQRRLGRAENAEHHQRQAQELTAQTKRLQEIAERLRQEPRNAELRYEAAMLNLQRGKDEDALLYLRSALQCDASHRPTHAALADLYEKFGNPRQAAFHRASASAGPGTPGF